MDFRDYTHRAALTDMLGPDERGDTHRSIRHRR